MILLLNFSKLKKHLLILFFISSWIFTCQASSNNDIVFDDRPLDEPLVLPDWFKLSFLEIQEDIKEAKEQNKKGLIIYFGQKYCPY